MKEKKPVAHERPRGVSPRGSAGATRAELSHTDLQALIESAQEEFLTSGGTITELNSYIYKPRQSTKMPEHWRNSITSGIDLRTQRQAELRKRLAPRVIALHEMGFSVAEIARFIETAQSTVRAILEENPPVKVAEEVD